MLDSWASHGAEPILRFIFFTDGNRGVNRGCEYPNVRQKGCRPRCLANFKAFRSCGRLAESSFHWNLRLGISKSWKPEFYPQALPQKKFLEFYATQLNSVEVNYTFRQLPTESMLAGWLAATGDGFPSRSKRHGLLRPSAQRLFRHSRRLGACARPGRGCRTDGFGALPASADFKADMSRLDSFLAVADACGLRMAFEFRHSTWFCDQVYTCCSVTLPRSVLLRATI